MRRWLNKPIRSWIEYVYSVASVKRGKSHATFNQFFFHLIGREIGAKVSQIVSVQNQRSHMISFVLLNLERLTTLELNVISCYFDI